METFDFGISLAFVLTLASALLCVVYGAFNWQAKNEEKSLGVKAWAKTEDTINKDL